MPTTAQMILKAEDLERRAAALRIAAAEMTDQAAANKAPLFPGALAQAVALRKQQRASTNGHAQNGHGPVQEAPGEATGEGIDREAFIRAALAEGPLPALALGAQLKAQGLPYSTSWILKVMQGMPDVRRVGGGHKTVYALRKPRTARAEAAPEPTVSPRRRKGSRKKTYPADIKEQRAVSAALLAKFSTDTPSKGHDLGLSTAEMRFLPPLSRYGYIKRRADGGYVRTHKVYTP